MKIDERRILRPKLGVGFKRFLLNLNRTLDAVKSDVNFNFTYGFYFNHSIHPNSPVLSKVEILTLLLEDRRFFLHSGFEFRSFLRVVRRFIRTGHIGGMSTIDQQVVRISTRRYERSLGRKLREILLAFLCNFHLSKKMILDYYIHNAYLGYKIEGCEIAANKIFKKSAADLGWDQAAFIASLFPLPFPKAAWDFYSADPRYPCNDPNEILEIVSKVSERWVNRVRSRMEFALANQGFKPKSL